MPTISHAAYVDRTTQREDTLYVMPDDTVWFTPDGEGRIYLYADADQTQPMTLLEARDETGFKRTVHVEHTCDWHTCDMADGVTTRCNG